MQAKARLCARAAKKILWLVQAVDTPTLDLPKSDYELMLAEPNVNQTKKLMGILPIYVGMEMILTETLLPPRYVPGTRVIVQGIEPHPDEPPIEGRQSIAAHGCVLLRFMPLCIYVKMKDATENFLQKEDTAHAKDAELAGVLAITPAKRLWRFASKHFVKGVHVHRSQIPLLPTKQCTLHGIQGNTGCSISSQVPSHMIGT